MTELLTVVPPHKHPRTGEEFDWTKVKIQQVYRHRGVDHVILKVLDKPVIVGMCTLGMFPSDAGLWVKGRVEHAEPLRSKFYSVYNISSDEPLWYIEALSSTGRWTDEDPRHPGLSVREVMDVHLGRKKGPNIRSDVEGLVMHPWRNKATGDVIEVVDFMESKWRSRSLDPMTRRVSEFNYLCLCKPWSGRVVSRQDQMQIWASDLIRDYDREWEL